MIGLRESQKELRRESIFAAALSLFGRQGFSATTVEDIAREAGVSAPTVVNYFGGKQEILIRLVERADRREAGDLWEEIDLCSNAVDALCRMYTLLVQGELRALPIAIWREVLSSVPSVSGSRELASLREMLAQDIAAMLRRLQGRGLLSSDLDVVFVAGILIDYSSLVFGRFVQDDDSDFMSHEAYVRRVCYMIVSGLRP